MSATATLTPRQIVATLDAVSRIRALTDAESRRLEQALRAAENARDRSPWSPAEDRALKEAIGRGCRVKLIAPAFGRPPYALYRRAFALGGGVKALRDGARE